MNTGKPLGEATEREIFDELRARRAKREATHMTRSEWAEARHVIRYAYQDLNGLFTNLGSGAAPSWQEMLLNIDEIVGSLDALRNFLTPHAQRPKKPQEPAEPEGDRSLAGWARVIERSTQSTREPEVPHCRHHPQFRSDCSQCVRERASS